MANNFANSIASQQTIATTIAKNKSSFNPSISRMSNRFDGRYIFSLYFSSSEIRVDDQNPEQSTLEPPQINVLKPQEKFIPPSRNALFPKEYDKIPTRDEPNFQSIQYTNLPSKEQKFNSFSPSPSMYQSNSSSQLSPEQAKKQNFLDSLKEQIALKEYRKKLEKMQQLEEDRRLAEEQNEYQYFGKAGAGGVKKDYFGKIIANRKVDPGSVVNLYGRESYNKITNIPSATPVPHTASNNENYESEMLKKFHKIKLQEELNQQIALERQLKEEQKRKELMQQQLEAAKLARQQEELRIQYLREQELLKAKQLSIKNETVIENNKKSRKVEEKLQPQTTTPVPPVVVAPPVQIPEKPKITYKTHVKLQADLAPELKPGDLDEKEFVKNLPAQVKSHISSVVDSELTRLINEMRHEENRVMDSIIALKVSFSVKIKNRKKFVMRIKEKKMR